MKATGLTAAATPCHNTFPVFGNHFSFFLLEPNPTGRFKCKSFLMSSKLVVCHNSNVDSPVLFHLWWWDQCSNGGVGHKHIRLGQWEVSGWWFELDWDMGMAGQKSSTWIGCAPLNQRETMWIIMLAVERMVLKMQKFLILSGRPPLCGLKRPQGLPHKQWSRKIWLTIWQDIWEGIEICSGCVRYTYGTFRNKEDRELQL